MKYAFASGAGDPGPGCVVFVLVSNKKRKKLNNRQLKKLLKGAQR